VTGYGLVGLGGPSGGTHVRRPDESMNLLNIHSGCSGHLMARMLRDQSWLLSSN